MSGREKLEQLRALHIKAKPRAVASVYIARCADCGDPWPCDMSLAVAALDEALAWLKVSGFDTDKILSKLEDR